MKAITKIILSFVVTVLSMSLVACRIQSSDGVPSESSSPEIQVPSASSEEESHPDDPNHSDEFTEGLEFTLNKKDNTYTVSDFTGDASEIVIPKFYKGAYVTAIGVAAFRDCTSVEVINIPEGVVSIGNYAFDGCTSLKNIYIPDSVRFTANNAFADCTALEYSEYDNALYIGNKDNPYFILIKAVDANITSCNIHKDTKIIFAKSFYNLNKLADVSIPDGVETVGDLAFRGCTLLEKVTLPDSVTTIGEESFANCKSLKELVIPSGITTVNSKAFQGCVALEKVTIPNNITTIGDYAFDGCSSLKEIVIPDSVTKVDKYAFRACASLIQLTIYGNDISFESFCFYNCTSLSDVTVHGKVEKFGIGSFNIGETADGLNTPIKINKSLKNCYISDLEAWLDPTNDISGFMNTEAALQVLDQNGDVIYDIVIPDTCTNIPKYAFKNCTATSFTISEGVLTIEENAFYYCTSLLSITLPKSLTSIDERSTEGCDKLVEVINRSNLDVSTNSVSNYALEIHSGESKIVKRDDYLFYTYNDTNYMIQYLGKATDLILPSDFDGKPYEINQHLFFECTELKSVVIPSSVTAIGIGAFGNCEGLKSVSISEGVRTVGNSAFAGCTALTSITLPDSIAAIPSAIFKLCTSLESVTLPKNITSIGSLAFNGCSSLKSITIPDSVTAIESFAFYGCSSLKSITIPDSVTVIERYMFSGCNKLEEISLPDGVTVIEDYAFSKCYSLSEITLPTNLTTIGTFAFEKCSNLESVIMFENVSTIKPGAFTDCKYTIKVYYKGSEEMWNKITIESSKYSGTTIREQHYYSETEPEVSGKYWHYVDGKPTVW